MIIWEQDPESGVFISSHRFGELEMGTNLGFFGALWGGKERDGEDKIMASGWGGSQFLLPLALRIAERVVSPFSGSWHVWKISPQPPYVYVPWTSISGHFKTVQSISRLLRIKPLVFMVLGKEMISRLGMNSQDLRFMVMI
jgi:hypothetical protein